MARTKTIPPRAHPIVKEIFARMNELNLSYMQVARRADIHPKILERWRMQSTPNMQTIERVLTALGMKLTVEKNNERN